MGKKANLSGVEPKGPDRIQFDFRIAGVRYRPTIYRTPSEANLRRAYQQLREIKARIKSGTFSFGEEFPDYRNKGDATKQRGQETKTCNDVFKGFLSHCEMRVAMDDLAYSTLEGYRKILYALWSPKIGETPFEKVVYSELAKIAAAHTRKKKTYNNVVSAIRTAFKFGYKDLPGQFNPTLALSTFRITKKDRPAVDPFTVPDAEAIISASHCIHGEWYGNYEEFRFFTGLRQSEQFALEVGDCDLVNGAIGITKALVLSREKNRTKTNQDREIYLCPRALEVLRAQLALRERMAAAGKISHDCVFFTEGGEPFQTVFLPYNRWREVMETLAVRYRKPYNARHTYISWRLMKGDNPLLVAQEDGHSVETMLRTYAAWIKGAKPEDIERIRRAMASRPSTDGVGDESGARGPLESPKTATTWPPAEQIDGLTAPVAATVSGATRVPSVCFNRDNGGKSATEELAGVGGFEPPNGGIKTRCLTTWRHPSSHPLNRAYHPCLRSIACSGERSRPRATKLSHRSGTRAAMRSASAARSKLANTHAPVPVMRAVIGAPCASICARSQASASATSGRRAHTTGSKTLTARLSAKARIVMMVEFRVNSGAWKISAVFTPTPG